MTDSSTTEWRSIHFELGRLVNGVSMDSSLHRQRIAYSVLIWVVTGGGQADQVPLAMVMVNVALFATLAWLGALVAESFHRSPWWGLAFCCFGGFVVTLSRDLTELTSSVLLLAAILSLRRERYFWAAGLLSVGVLARESVGVLVAALAIVRVVGLLRRQHGFGPSDIAWGVPTVVFIAMASDSGPCVRRHSGAVGARRYRPTGCCGGARVCRVDAATDARDDARLDWDLQLGAPARPDAAGTARGLGVDPNGARARGCTCRQPVRCRVE